MGCLDRKYPILFEKFINGEFRSKIPSVGKKDENGVLRSKVPHLSRKIRKWGV